MSSPISSRSNYGYQVTDMDGHGVCRWQRSHECGTPCTPSFIVVVRH